MIIVDANVVAYLLIPGEQTDKAKEVLKKDPAWHAPLLWRTGFSSILLKCVRKGEFEIDEALTLFQKARELMLGGEHEVASQDALRLAVQSGRSVYDCEYVALAQDLGMKLITADGRVVTSFSGVALSLDSFLNEHKTEKSKR